MRTRAAYAALLANPPAVLDGRFPRADLLVGRQPVRNALSRLKHRAFGHRAVDG
jgi:hypothetical protein